MSNIPGVAVFPDTAALNGCIKEPADKDNFELKFLKLCSINSGFENSIEEKTSSIFRH